MASHSHAPYISCFDLHCDNILCYSTALCPHVCTSTFNKAISLVSVTNVFLSLPSSSYTYTHVHKYVKYMTSRKQLHHISPSWHCYSIRALAPLSRLLHKLKLSKSHEIDGDCFLHMKSYSSIIHQTEKPTIPCPNPPPSSSQLHYEASRDK